MDIKAIAYSHDSKTAHLSDVSVRIQEGAITTIIGPNGCGKSTLLGVMSRHYRLKEGCVLLDGKELSLLKPRELAQKLAIVHQQQEAPGDTTVEKLVRFGRMPHRKLFRAGSDEDEAAVEWALHAAGIDHKRSSILAHLSGGERQRAWIAMALAQRTPLLFLDEPTTYLDLYHQLGLLELVRTLNQENGLTIVMVLHDMNQAIRYSDHIIIMKEGRIVGEGTPESVMTEEMILSTYQVRVAVKSDAHSGLYMVPVGI